LEFELSTDSNHFGVKILNKDVRKDEKPSDLEDKKKGVIGRIKKIFLQVMNVIAEVFSTILGSIFG